RLISNLDGGRCADVGRAARMRRSRTRPGCQMDRSAGVGVPTIVDLEPQTMVDARTRHADGMSAERPPSGGFRGRSTTVYGGRGGSTTVYGGRGRSTTV